jgi:hypothetical protein
VVEEAEEVVSVEGIEADFVVEEDFHEEVVVDSEEGRVAIVHTVEEIPVMEVVVDEGFQEAAAEDFQEAVVEEAAVTPEAVKEVSEVVEVMLEEAVVATVEVAMVEVEVAMEVEVVALTEVADMVETTVKEVERLFDTLKYPLLEAF